MRQVNDVDILTAIYKSANRTNDPEDDAQVEDLEAVRQIMHDRIKEELKDILSEYDAKHYYNEMMEYAEQVGYVQFVKGFEAGVHIQKVIDRL